MQAGELGAHRDAQLRVEVRERLVHQERPRLAHDRATHRDALALAARQVSRLAVEQVIEPELARDVAHARLALLPRRLAQLEAVGEVLRHRHVRVQRVVLEHHRDVALLRLAHRHVLVADRDRALGRVLETRDRAQQRGLAAAGRADEHHELAVADLEADPVDRRDAVREPLGHVSQADAAHPLLAPRVRPPMKCRCSTANTMSVGIAASIEPAAIRLLSVKKTPSRFASARRDRPLVAGLDQHDRPEEVVVDQVNSSVASAASAGRQSGRMMPKNCRATPAPSTRAASVSSTAGSSSCSSTARTCRTRAGRRC